MPGHRKRPPDYRSPGLLDRRARGRMLRSRATSQAMAHPPIQVRGNQHWGWRCQCERGRNLLFPRSGKLPRGECRPASSRLVTQGVQPNSVGASRKNMYHRSALERAGGPGRAMQPTKKKPNGAQADPQRQEDHHGFFCGQPQIVHAPAEGSWTVPVENKAGDEPGRKYKPKENLYTA